MTNEQIAEILSEHDITLLDVIEVVIETNGIIGVGLITLADELAEHIRSLI